MTGVAGLLLRSLVALSPRKRASVYRLRYGDGYSTIVRVQWHEGGINSDAPLDNAYVEAIVSVVPIPKDRQEVMPADIEPHKSVLSCLESIDGLRSQRCSLEWRLLAADESPLRATAEKCNFVNVVEAEYGYGWIDKCTIEQASREEVSNLLTGMRCVNFPNATVSDDDESRAKVVRNPRKRKSREESGQIEADVSGQETEANNENPAAPAKPAVANARATSNTKSKKGRAKDPNKPKAPLTPFNLFAKDRREGIKKSNPDKNGNEISTLVGEAWKALADDERRPYLDDAAVKRAEYKEAMARYNDSKE